MPILKVFWNSWKNAFLIIKTVAVEREFTLRFARSKHTKNGWKGASCAFTQKILAILFDAINFFKVVIY